MKINHKLSDIKKQISKCGREARTVMTFVRCHLDICPIDSDNNRLDDIEITNLELSELTMKRIKSEVEYYMKNDECSSVSLDVRYDGVDSLKDWEFGDYEAFIAETDIELWRK